MFIYLDDQGLLKKGGVASWFAWKVKKNWFKNLSYLGTILISSFCSLFLAVRRSGWVVGKREDLLWSWNANKVHVYQINTAAGGFNRLRRTAARLFAYTLVLSAQTCLVRSRVRGMRGIFSREMSTVVDVGNLNYWSSWRGSFTRKRWRHSLLFFPRALISCPIAVFFFLHR